MESGEQCVVNTGATVMPQLLADSWDTVQLAVMIFPSPVVHLPRGSGWTGLDAQEVNLN